ncbi:MAG: serine hydrolase [Paracoccaceae bacterium]
MASLFGRILRGIFLFVALAALLPAQRAVAAPFAAIVIDARSGEVLYEKNADTRLHPASLTKMMTLYIVFQEIEAGRIHLDDKVTISKNAAAQPPSRLGLRAGQKIALRYLIRAAAVKSANDAAMALGEYVSGSQEAFAKRMTKTAKALGMRNTTFKNPNGLTAEGHLSTARDMTIMGRHLFYDFPQYYNIFSRRSADAGMATVHNTNSRFLDGYEGADGIKTGYTVAAGFNLTASAQRGNKRIIATVFGGTSTAARNAKMAELMDLGFGAAKKNVREKIPEAAPLPDDALVAEALAEVDEPGAQGGAAKTIRVSGEVTRSLRPKARPAPAVAVAAAAPAEDLVSDALSQAIAASVDDALGEALAPPAPEGTLEAQAQALAAAPEAALDTLPEPPLGDLAETAPAERPSTLASADPMPAEAPPAGTLEAQAAALAAGAAPLSEEVPEDTLQAQAVALAEAAPVAAATDPALAEARPLPRPETVAAPEVQLAEAVPLAEAPPPAEPVLVAPAEDSPLAADEPRLTDVETVAAALMAPAPDTQPTRNAPIFETVEPAVEIAAAETVAEPQVVVAKSTSGGRHWGVNVGDFTSRSEAERALLKTALAESATLNQGLRKISQSGGSYHANFMGLTEDQADLACRRLKARGVPCETLGP